MPSDSVLIHFIDKMGVELLFVIGVLIILTYIAIKAIPMFKELRIKKLDNEQVLAEKKLVIDETREKRKAEEHQQDLERDQARTEAIAAQNEILTTLARGFEAQQIQLATLTTALEDSKTHSRSLGETVDDTNQVVHDIFKITTSIDDNLRRK